MERLENIRRTAEVAALFRDSGFIVVCALISPEAAHRQLARTIVGERYFEVHIDSCIAVCESRDPKGLCARARRGELREFTGISAPYELPTSPDIAIDTAHSSVDDAAARLYAFVRNRIRPVTVEA